MKAALFTEEVEAPSISKGEPGWWAVEMHNDAFELPNFLANVRSTSRPGALLGRPLGPDGTNKVAYFEDRQVAEREAHLARHQFIRTTYTVIPISAVPLPLHERFERYDPTKTETCR